MNIPHARSPSPVEKGNSFVNQDPREPTAEGNFTLEVWRIARSRSPAASHGILRFILTAENADGEEVEQAAASREPILENLGIGVNVQYFFIAFH
jgi:hypothetical protein